jgi:hypothetical protein
MNKHTWNTVRRTIIVLAVMALLIGQALLSLHGYVRTARRGVATGEHGGVAAGPRGAVVKGDEGYAAARRGGGAVAAGEEGYAARGRYGGTVVSGEEGVSTVGRYEGIEGGVIVGESYESHEAWGAVAGVGAGIAIGTMLARPPTTSTTVVVDGNTYWQDGSTYYTRVYSGGNVVYQAVPPPQ